MLKEDEDNYEKKGLHKLFKFVASNLKFVDDENFF